MTLQELASLGQSQGFRVVGNQMLGVYKGYPFSLTMQSKSTYDIISMSFTVDGRIPGKLLKAIRKKLPKGASLASPAAGQLNVTCPDKEDMGTYRLTMTALDTVTGSLASAEVPLTLPAKCPYCNNEMCDSVAIVNGRYVPVHRHCLTEQTRAETSKARINEESGNYLTGFIGALLGAIVGCIPNIILIFAVQREYGILYMLIPLASYFGYTLFKGRIGGVARVMVIVCSILAFAVMQPAVFCIYYMLEGYRGSLSPVLRMYFQEYLPYYGVSGFISDIWFGTLSLIIGFVSSFKTIGSTNHDRIANAAVNMESITSLNTDGELAKQPNVHE